MTDDMPDFDSMSPEEMMKWMESLAVRQGATEGLTTEADMEVAEVNEDDERLAGKGDYVPYGWTEEKWKEHLAKEEAEKAAKAAATPPPPPPTPEPEPVAAPEPEPEPEPAAPAASAGGEPDFDSMSPEEMMKWMESLAVRQGATEGLTTEADMEVAEVDASDERLAGKGDYVPYGWTEERWKEHLAKEEAEKAAKAAAPPPAATPATPEPVAEEVQEEVPDDVLAAPSLDDLFGGNNVIGDDDDDAEDESAGMDMPSFDDLFGGDAPSNEIPELDLSALEGLGGASDASDSPMDWLAGLAGGDDDGANDIDMGALESLSALGGDDPETPVDEPVASPTDWLAGLADSGGEEPVDEADDQEGSLEWLETLAKQEGANTEELATSANLDIPMPDGVLDDTGPGYEDFSFEQGSGMIIEDDEDDELMPAFDVDSMDMEDPENWLDSLAQAQSGTGNVIGLGDDIDDDSDDDATDIPNFDDVSTDIRDKINSGNVSPDEIKLLFGTAFDAANKRTDVPDYIDSEDDFDLDDDEIEAPVQAEIPDWLQEQMSAVPEDSGDADIKKTDTAEMMMMNLGLDNEIEEAEELPDWLSGGDDASEAEAAAVAEDLPDWLSGGASDDTGDIAADIFEDLPAAEVDAPADKSTEEVLIADTEDNWVQAFQQEASGELERWYEEKTGGDSEPITPVQPAASTEGATVTLQAADLPMETKLLHGEAMAVPDWLSGDAAPAIAATDMSSIETPAADDVDMDWLGGGDSLDAVEADMPDWLREQVDDSVAPAEELPSWLAGDDIDIESVEDIPDWLRETMGEEEAAVADVDFTIEAEPAAATPEPDPTPATPPPAAKPVTAAPVPVQKSPAPVPVAAAVDVSAALQEAQAKVSAGDIDGAMIDFESVVRANQALDMVEKALNKIADHNDHKRNPTVYRVLGDVLMRQGKLQQALDTYRRALNML